MRPSDGRAKKVYETKLRQKQKALAIVAESLGHEIPSDVPAFSDEDRCTNCGTFVVQIMQAPAPLLCPYAVSTLLIRGDDHERLRVASAIRGLLRPSLERHTELAKAARRRRRRREAAAKKRGSAKTRR